MGFEFDDKNVEEGVEDLSRETMEQNVEKRINPSLETDQCDADQGMMG